MRLIAVAILTFSICSVGSEEVDKININQINHNQLNFLPIGQNKINNNTLSSFMSKSLIKLIFR